MNDYSTRGTEYNFLDEIKDDLFPHPKRHCDECGRRLSAGNRCQIVVRHIQRGLPQGVFVGFEICKRCVKVAAKGEAPNLNKKTDDAFLHSLTGVGGMQ
ncbi:hypothetical protein BCL93_105124 [Onishia taeanensis]|uniref:Uncharacterized protein n=1 Tax=Onishia taeanensis TaxID=284577 RepID=A0A328XNZ1_9GAMM|nr:hypothetical protein [Halomonas taeanensis]RAR61523.1 hypothetical protein BCL93_105124 [Halomonas taeanensis]